MLSGIVRGDLGLLLNTGSGAFLDRGRSIVVDTVDAGSGLAVVGTDGVDKVHTVVAVVDIDGVTVVQSLERTRNVDVEVKVVLVLGLVDSLEATEDVLMDVGGERLEALIW